MDLGITGRVAVVAVVAASTGGLGRAVAAVLAAEGARVVVSGRRGEVAKEIAAGFPDAIGVEADLATADGPGRLVETAVTAYGPVDILVLNGPGPRPGQAAEVTDADLAAATDSLLLAQQRPIGRYGTPAEFGAVAAFLCSASAAYVTGTAMRCDGGLVPTL